MNHGYQQRRVAPAEGLGTAPAVLGDYGSNQDQITALGEQSPSEDSFLGAALAEVSPSPSVRATGQGTTGSPISDDFSQAAQALFSRLDVDSDGFLSAQEIDEAVIDASITGAEAAVVATLNQLADELEELSDDEWGDENDGVSLADLQAYERTAVVPGGLRERVLGDFLGNVDEIANQDTSLWGSTKEPTVEAVNQRGLGDCAFLAAVAAVVTREPATIKGMIEESSDQSFRVSFRNQTRQTVSKPTDAEIAQYAYGGTYGIWVAVLEKAFGQLKDPDSAIPSEGADGGGLLAYAIWVLTGQSTDFDMLALNTREETKLQLTEAFDERRIVTAATNRALPWEDEQEKGVVKGHAYSVLGWDPASEVLTLRNPWGYGERTDDADVTEDGVFEMSLDLFLQYFDTICYELGSGSPIVPGTPEKQHVVAAGETLAGIATRYYGIMRLYGDLVTANYGTITNADEITPGMTLHIPRLDTPVVSVREGETLTSIARYWYGTPERAADIFEENEGLKDPDVLPVGASLRIPMVGAELLPLS
jgi:nucleoid-associated protein YgaU